MSTYDFLADRVEQLDKRLSSIEHHFRPEGTVVCEACNGRGRIPFSDIAWEHCVACNGRGYATAKASENAKDYVTRHYPGAYPMPDMIYVFPNGVECDAFQVVDGADPFLPFLGDVAPTVHLAWQSAQRKVLAANTISRLKRHADSLAAADTFVCDTREVA